MVIKAYSGPSVALTYSKLCYIPNSGMFKTVGIYM